MFLLRENIALGESNWGSKLEPYRTKGKVTGNENVKIVFRAYLRESGSINIKLRPK